MTHQILWAGNGNGLLRSPPNGLEQPYGECLALGTCQGRGGLMVRSWLRNMRVQDSIPLRDPPCKRAFRTFNLTACVKRRVVWCKNRFGLVILTSRFEAKRGLIWDGPRNFETRSDDDT
ncbi:hypothetical protein AVEN_274555-1 [Araneus ventricosus]|uniref:Uncharacterized protein n=1 Tax=Araneus ventricosus TaxID=182803 RepID=A0A4Y2JIH6_ARAVE|nr:hypothetical protein AVEN_274555-1 [Araneus ventricosus]